MPSMSCGGRRGHGTSRCQGRIRTRGAAMPRTERRAPAGLPTPRSTWRTTVWPPLPPTTPDGAPPPIPHDLPGAGGTVSRATRGPPPSPRSGRRTRSGPTAVSATSRSIPRPELFTRPVGCRSIAPEVRHEPGPARVARLCVAAAWLTSGCARTPSGVRGGPRRRGPNHRGDGRLGDRGAATRRGSRVHWRRCRRCPSIAGRGRAIAPFEVALRSAAPEAGHARRFGTITLPIALRSARRPRSVPLHVLSLGPEGGHGRQAHRRRPPEHPAGAPGPDRRPLLHLPCGRRTSSCWRSRPGSARPWTRATGCARNVTSRR